MVVIGFAIRVLVVGLTIGPYLEPDQTQFAFGLEGGRIAASIARGEGFSNPLTIPTGPSAWRSPVYPYLMAGFFKVFGIHTLAAAIAMYAMNCFISAITCVPLYRLGVLSFDERVGRWAGWIWAFFPYAIVNSTQKIFDTPLSALLVAWLILDTLKMRHVTSARRWIWHGALWAFAALTQTGVLILLPFYWLWVMWQMQAPFRQRVRLVTVGGLVFALGIAPWIVRNYVVFGKFVPFRSNIAMELHVGNQHGLELPRSDAHHPTSNSREAKLMQDLGEVPYMEAKMEQFKQFVREHPGEFATRSIRRFFHYWTSAWDIRPASLAAKPFESADIPFATFVTVLGVLGLIQLWGTNRAEAMLYAIFLALYPLVFYVTHRSYRYRHPVDPVLVLLGAAAMAAWWARRRGEAAVTGGENRTSTGH